MRHSCGWRADYHWGMTSLRGFCLVAVASMALAPAPAAAADAGGAALSVLETVGVFVLLPVSIYGVIWLLWSIPKWRREADPSATSDAWNPRPLP